MLDRADQVVGIGVVQLPVEAAEVLFETPRLVRRLVGEVRVRIADHLQLDDRGPVVGVAPVFGREPGPFGGGIVFLAGPPEADLDPVVFLVRKVAPVDPIEAGHERAAVETDDPAPRGQGRLGGKRGLLARIGGVIGETDFVVLVRTGVDIGGKDADLFDRLRLTQVVDQTGRFPFHRRTAAEPQSADFPVNQEIVPADLFVDGHLGARKGDQVLEDVLVDQLLNIRHQGIVTAEGKRLKRDAVKRRRAEQKSCRKKKEDRKKGQGQVTFHG